jgi:HSP90 family molecular chaperone
MARKSTAPDASSVNLHEQSECQIDIQGLIKSLAKSFYAEDDIFVREMLQNAHGSAKRRRKLQEEGVPLREVRVKIC